MPDILGSKVICSKKELEKVKKWKSKYKTKDKTKYYNSVLAVDEKLKKFSGFEEYIKFSKILKQFNNNKNIIIDSIVKIYLYSSWENSKKVNEIIYNFNQRDKAHDYLMRPTFFVDTQMGWKIQSKLYALLKVLKSRYEDNIDFLFFSFQIIKYFDDTFQNKLNELFNFDWSLSHIRTLMEGPSHKKRYVAFFVNQLDKRNATREAQKLVVDYFENASWQRYFHYNYPVLKILIPNELATRATLMDLVSSYFYSKNEVDQLRFLEITSNEAMYQLYFQKNQLDKKPLFTIKRNFYKSMVKKGHYLPLFLLAELGDYEQLLEIW